MSTKISISFPIQNDVWFSALWTPAATSTQPAAERRDLRLPLVAEREDQHLLVDVRVLGQRLHRAAACRR